MTNENTVDESEEADEETDDGGLQQGDFVKIAYTARTVEGGDLVDTTDLETAEEEGIETEERDFSPRTIVLGEGHLFPAVEEDIEGKSVGSEGSVVVSSTEAFGEYQEEEVRTVKADKIPEDDRYPGAHVDIDGEHGHVETIVGGRARVDFNHPLAGQDIEYDYEVVDTVEDRVEQASGLLQMYFDVDLDMHIDTDEVETEVTVEPDEEDAEPETTTEIEAQETLYIESDPQLQFNQQWMMSKQQILGDVMDKIGVDRVIVQEIIDGSGMPGMGMGGMGGGLGDIDEALEDADIDADEIIDELDEEGEDVDADELLDEE
ncbi:FKBP-type peptidyl-prolyl cis-trans isomerase [Halanaeroarchaeum sulfurireducens]|uniref:Peptidyl-prolyl cis-trans isomerase n=1 Tax=Halanaeroarchaeum sulfurireducens TaxID=1604004 RepID=A0A0F7PBJ7_9EURY|nr:peptidylprolyl isomerase [Halanaeroarchaeum sulfurireducens]AKH98067.1 peptidylprolyl isomerase [Halanaeroarchaeum sulfurireducens]ALG82461.1 peptidylprolyl isomerase [Halanaeroarchaeum sulfurireducens]